MYVPRDAALPHTLSQIVGNSYRQSFDSDINSSTVVLCRGRSPDVVIIRYDLTPYNAAGGEVPLRDLSSREQTDRTLTSALYLTTFDSTHTVQRGWPGPLQTHGSASATRGVSHLAYVTRQRSLSATQLRCMQVSHASRLTDVVDTVH